jgi:hypothetical protein
MSQSVDPPIIISGGSVTIEFDKVKLKDKGDGKHHHPDKKIKRVEVNGDDVTSYVANTNSGKVTIKIYYGD